MSTFRHPFLTRGIVRFANHAFQVSRGLVELPDEIGESLGWHKVERNDDFVLPPPESQGKRSSKLVKTPNHQ